MLKKPSLNKAIKMASVCSIIDQKTKELIPFKLNHEQTELLKLALSDENFIQLLKSRQVGGSTIFCFLDSLFAITNEGIKIAIVADTQPKANDLLSKCKSFILDFGLEDCIEVNNTKRLKLNNGSEILALTAGGGSSKEESKVGRSQSYQLLHLTELPFWSNQNAYSALLATSSGAPIFLESTAKGSDDLFWKLWTTENKFKKVFFSVEDHENYKESAESLIEESWLQAQSLGFKNKESAAWWFKALQDQGGDLIKHLHDYPVLPEHAFATYKGKWINPKINNNKSYYLHNDLYFITNNINYNQEHIISVDTSGGIGKDSNCIVCINRITQEISAYWKDNTATIDTIITILKDLNKKFKVGTNIIEVNGVGRGTVQFAQMAGLSITELTTTESSKYKNLLASKRYLEGGNHSVPLEIIEETNSLHLNNKGQFSGSKDSLMTLGFALVYMDEHQLIINRPPIKNPNIYNPEDWIPKPPSITGYF